jgi:acetyltransferase-like isoleucine patch superfamily enzyme
MALNYLKKIAKYILLKLFSKPFSFLLLNTPKIWGNKNRLILANNVQLNDCTINLIGGTVQIGENVFFGHSCMIITGTHDYNLFGKCRMNNFIKEGRNVIIEEGVWIGSGAIILGPCLIKRDSVIGAGSIIISNSVIPEKSIVVGIPGKVINKIMSNEGYVGK